jgi:hypothetical protein
MRIPEGWTCNKISHKLTEAQIQNLKAPSCIKHFNLTKKIFNLNEDELINEGRLSFIEIEITTSILKGN